jgi:hypothetical protein
MEDLSWSASQVFTASGKAFQCKKWILRFVSVTLALIYEVKTGDTGNPCRTRNSGSHSEILPLKSFLTSQDGWEDGGL